METVTITKAELAGIVLTVTREVLSSLPKEPHLPKYYHMPTDIVAIMRDKISPGRVRNWASSGYLRTVKIGANSYVTPDDWDWFVKNHAPLMRKDSNHVSKQNKK